MIASSYFSYARFIVKAYFTFCIVILLTALNSVSYVCYVLFYKYSN